MTIVSMLERFQGYTLSTLLAEDAQLLHMVRMVDMERRVNGRGEDDDQRDQDFGAYAEQF